MAGRGQFGNSETIACLVCRVTDKLLLVLHNAWSPSMYRNDRLAQNHPVLCTCPLESISILRFGRVVS